MGWVVTSRCGCLDSCLMLWHLHICTPASNGSHQRYMLNTVCRL
jgi:hypothetical protein